MTGIVRDEALDEAADDSLFAPAWARAVVGGAAAVIAGEVVRMLVARRGGAQGAEPGGLLLLLLLPGAFAAAASVIADLDRDEPRTSLALWMAGALTIGVIVCAVSPGPLGGTFAIPFAAAFPIGLRAFWTPAPRGVDRTDFLIGWIFAGAFWPAIIALGAGFIIHNLTPIQPQGAPPVAISHVARLGIEAAYAIAPACIGAVFTLALIQLDPDRSEAPPETLTPPADTQAG